MTFINYKLYFYVKINNKILPLYKYGMDVTKNTKLGSVLIIAGTNHSLINMKYLIH